MEWLVNDSLAQSAQGILLSSFFQIRILNHNFLLSAKHLTILSHSYTFNSYVKKTP